METQRYHARSAGSVCDKATRHLPLLLCLCLVLGSTRVLSAQNGVAPLPALTAEERAWLDGNTGSLTLLCNADWAPIAFASSSNTCTGMGMDVVAMVEQRLGVVFARRIASDWRSLYAALESGECAVAPAIARDQDGDSRIFLTPPYATLPVVLITRKAGAESLTLDDLAGRRLAVVAGHPAEPYLRRRAQERFEIVSVTTVVEGLRRVASGQVDAFAEGFAVASYYIEKEGIPDLRVAGNTGFETAWSIGVSRKYPLLCSSVQKALTAVPGGQVAEARSRWIPLDLSPWLDPRTRRNLQRVNLLVAVVLMALAAVAYVLKRRLNDKVARLATAHKELQEKAEHLKLATEATPAGIWDFYPAAGLGYMDAQWHTMFGYTPQTDAIPLPDWGKFVHPDDLPATERAFRDYIAAGGHDTFEAEFRVRRADGTWCWVLSKGRAIAWDAKGAPSRIIGLHLSIQRMRTVQEELAQSEARFRALFRMAPIPLGDSHRDGNIIELNDRFTQLLGYTVSDIPTLDRWWTLACPDPEYRRAAMSSWQQAVAHTTESGAAVEAGEYHVTCKDGVTRTMVIAAKATGTSILASFFDITERERVEQEKDRLQRQLLQSQKMEALGVLAGGVAHDFNNMLGAIMGYADLTLAEMSPDDPYRGNLERILEGAQRSAGLTRQLLAFARQQAAAPVVFDVNESVEALLRLLRRLISENITLAWLPCKGPCMVRMDPTQLDQILANLCVNSSDAIASVGKITIETRTVTLDEGYCRAHTGALPGEYVQLAVTDDGCGMDAETLRHMFEPFFTTKGLGKGTGLGLATVYGIVKQSNGFVDVRSERGVGTTFRVHIPRHAARATEHGAAVEAELPRSRGETILLVEDDPALLRLGALMLESLGYSVLPASLPSEAIRLAEETPSEIQMFITDVVMPEMNGRELAERLHKIRPTIKRLFMSGYTANVIVPRGILTENADFLQKPFSLKDLATKVREILG